MHPSDGHADDPTMMTAMMMTMVMIKESGMSQPYPTLMTQEA
jgi:hypothetical protein